MLEPNEYFAEAVRALWGAHGMAQAGDALGVRADSIRHWCSGRRSIPPTIWDRITNLVIERHEEIERLEINLGFAQERAKELWDARPNRTTPI